MLIYPYGDIVYTLCIIVGILCALFIAVIYLKKQGVNKIEIIDLLFTLLGSIILGFVFAFAFQTLYDVIQQGSAYQFSFKMTFFGGLIGGVFSFLLLYHFYYRRRHASQLKKLLIIAPGSICIGHFFGRLGCFATGCCYGRPTDSIIGIIFPSLNDGLKRIPTQLIEAIFLLILGTVLVYLAFKTHFEYQMVIYLFAYSIFRFVIEFYRGDDRGGIINCPLSPSQMICLIIFVSIIPIYFIIKKHVLKEESHHEI